MPLPPPDTKFLIVDDMATMRRIIRSILNQLGYQNIDEAEDGKVALQKLKSQKYDFVITDWNMPNMTGIELVQAIRKDPELKHLPVLMVTAEAKKENVIMALKAGVNNYIVKPFTPATLKQKLEQVWNQVLKARQGQK
jgi:two-component system chemotaxis response regulator CheY